MSTLGPAVVAGLASIALATGFVPRGGDDPKPETPAAQAAPMQRPVEVPCSERDCFMVGQELPGEPGVYYPGCVGGCPGDEYTCDLVAETLLSYVCNCAWDGEGEPPEVDDPPPLTVCHATASPLIFGTPGTFAIICGGDCSGGQPCEASGDPPPNPFCKRN